MIGFILGTIGIGLALLGLLLAESINMIKKGKQEKNPSIIFAGIYGLLCVISFILVCIKKA